MSDTYTEVLARDWTVTVGATTPLPIPNLETIGFDSTAKEADITSFSNAGNDDHTITSRGRTLKLAGFYYEDTTGKAVEPGLAALIALGEQTGASAKDQFVVTDPAGVTRTFNASVTMDTIGGGKDDPTKFTATLKVAGGVTFGTAGGA